MINTVALIAVLGSLLIMAILYYRVNKRWRESETWPSIDGRVLNCRVIDKKIVFTPEAGETQIYYEYRVKMKYLYDLLSKTYFEEGWLPFETKLGKTLLTSAIATRSKKKAYDKASQFRAGQKLTVYYDPVRPQNSTLKPGIDYQKTFWYRLGFLVAFVGGSSLACLLGLRALGG